MDSLYLSLIFFLALAVLVLSGLLGLRFQKSETHEQTDTTRLGYLEILVAAKNAQLDALTTLVYFSPQMSQFYAEGSCRPSTAVAMSTWLANCYPEKYRKEVLLRAIGVWKDLDCAVESFPKECDVSELICEARKKHSEMMSFLEQAR